MTSTGMDRNLGAIRRWCDSVFGPRVAARPAEGAGTPSILEINAAAAMWNAREKLVFEIDWKEDEPDHGRFSYDTPDVTIVLPDERRIVLTHQSQSMGWTCVFTCMQDVWTPTATLISPDGQTRDVGRSRPIADTWRAVVADRMARDLGLAEVAAGENAEECRLTDVLEAAVMHQAPMHCPETYLVQPRVRSWTGERPADPDPFPQPTPWSRLPGEWLIRTEQRAYEVDVRNASGKGSERHPGSATVALVSHPDVGVATVPGDVVEKALETRNRISIEGAFGGATPRRIPSITGNARASQIVALASRALDLDADLRDAAGTPIAPLVDKHIPDLLTAHANALRTARASEASDIDGQLEQGLEIVRAAVEQGLAARASADRDALRTELAFLRYRHPEDPMRQDGP